VARNLAAEIWKAAEVAPGPRQAERSTPLSGRPGLIEKEDRLPASISASTSAAEYSRTEQTGEMSVKQALYRK